MKKDTVVSIEEPTTAKDALTEVLREGALKLLAEAVQAELEELPEAYQDECDGESRQGLVRNGYLPAREIQTGLEGSRFRSSGFGTGDRAKRRKRSSAFARSWCRPISDAAKASRSCCRCCT